MCVEAEVTSVCRMSFCLFVLQLELMIMYIKVCLTALLDSSSVLFMVCIPAVVSFLNYNESCTYDPSSSHILYVSYLYLFYFARI